MVPKRKSSETWKENEALIDYNRVKFASLVAKVWSTKATKINKNFIVQRGMKFEVKQYPF